MKLKGRAVYVVIAVFVLAALGCVYWGADNWYSHNAMRNTTDTNKLSDYGSYLQGAVASPWALAGVLLIIATLLFQAEQLRLQREDSAEQREQFRRQDQTAIQQAFDSTFFELLKRQVDLAAQMKVSVKEENNPVEEVSQYSGPDAFNGLYEDFKHRLLGRLCTPELAERFGVEIPASIERDEFKVTQQYYSDYLNQYYPLANYFRNLMHLLGFIDKSDVKDKQWYANSVGLQLTQPELALFFYHVLTTHGESIKPFTEKYHFFDNLDKSTLVDKPHKDLHMDQNAWKVITGPSFEQQLKRYETKTETSPELGSVPDSNKTSNSAEQSETAQDGRNNAKPSEQSGDKAHASP